MRARRVKNSIPEVSAAGAFASHTVRRPRRFAGRDQPARWRNRPSVGADLCDWPLLARSAAIRSDNISTSEKGRLGRCTNSCASSQRWSRSRPSCNTFFRTVHGNQAAMDGFGEYRSDLPLREAQLILEEYLRPRPQNHERILDKLVEVLERPDLVVAVSRLQRQSSLAVR